MIRTVSIVVGAAEAGGFVLPGGPKGAMPWVMAHCITD
jgi:hypothetical protein